MVTRRDLVVALIAVATTVCVVDVLSASSVETPVMQSALFDWNAITLKQTNVGAVRQFFEDLQAHWTS
jgi:hypothetical protein